MRITVVNNNILIIIKIHFKSKKYQNEYEDKSLIYILFKNYYYIIFNIKKNKINNYL